MDTLAITLGVSILIYIVVGSYAGRSIKKLDDYFVAGRRAPTLLILGTLVASVMSTSIFMGEAAFTYDSQFGAYLLFPGIAVTGYMLGALFFGTYLRRSRAPTVADFFGARFQSRRLQQFAGFTIILGLGGYLLIVTQGAAILLSEITGLPFVMSLLIAWFSYTLFTMYSGSKGVIITDTLMFLLFMTASVVFVFYVVDGFGGLRTAITDLAQLQSKPGLASWTGIIGPGTSWPTALEFVIWVVVVDISWAFVYAVGPWQASRHLMARDEHVVLRAAILACFCVILLQMLIYGIGGLMNLANDNITPSETVVIWGAQNLVPEFLGAILLAGIVAAALSSASTFLSLVGFSISNDIGRRPIAMSVSTTRKIMLATSVIVLICCYFFPPNIFWFMLFIGTVYASSWGPVGLMAIWGQAHHEGRRFLGDGDRVLPERYSGGDQLPGHLSLARVRTGRDWHHRKHRGHSRCLGTRHGQPGGKGLSAAFASTSGVRYRPGQDPQDPAGTVGTGRLRRHDAFAIVEVLRSAVSNRHKRDFC